ncbi:DotU/TssL family secretion system protein [Caballeronia sp. J97]|uniref:DotU/TssL family secretion system protein n=1 Tax=Caballeronia sp. J97 TaxID=2805429 RepID=UPI002AAF8CCA|nr:DotU/TssL family secretion system protein [Caballeronia sp. J97]
MTSNLDADLLPVALRGTALMVADLADDSKEKSATDLKVTCKAQIMALTAELKAKRYPPDVIEDARYAQCALLDEAALNSFKGDDRDDWERQPLQLDEFKTNDAGEDLVRRIQERLRDPRPVRPLLAIFGAVLDLGFTGRLALDGSEAKLRLRQAIDARLGIVQGQNDDTSVVIKAPVAHSWTQRISPLAFSALACATILMLFLVDIAIAFLARALPQMNALMLGLQVKTIVTLSVASLSVGLVASATLRLLDYALRFAASLE